MLAVIMSNTFQLATNLFLKGLRDAVLGISAIYSLDLDQQAKQRALEIKQKTKHKALSILAQRREGRVKNKSVMKDK